ncbi:kinesin-like protein KIN-14R isoform X2 [Nymphaea colorata]|uniref:kinesin-like protein KIN-14R isoform X2 n=1 Tax=Nymphaea colorata TaxID=210225 RepID=UPI00129D7A13|nr:kinesin-like protein KIN-14R isoform X2 [Nymphaea colorata]
MAGSGVDDALLADAASQSQTSDSTRMPDSVREDEKNAFLGSLTAPDLVICKGSPEIHVEGFLQDTPESITKRPRRNRIYFKDDLPEKVMGEPRAQQTLSPSAADVAFSEERSLEAGILDGVSGVQEIQTKLQNGQNGFPKVTEKGSRPVICINSGGDCLSLASGSCDLSADAFFTGGEEEGPSVYQTATSGEGNTDIGLALQAHTIKEKQDLLQDNCEQCTCNAQKQVSKFKEEYERLQKEQEENNRTLEKLKKENEFKDRECQKARMSLQELHNELMRKSMHVGSLAFAVEGQVKEKSLWFSCLQEISKKFKALKLEHQNLLEEALECNRCFKGVSDLASNINSIVSRHADLGQEHEDLKAKFVRATREQKQLYNKIVEMKGNIRVFCRCRPLSKEEIEAGSSTAVEFESAKDGEVAVRTNGGTKKLFKYDAVFSPQASQAEVFEETAPFAASVLDGYNVCIFAYGQTGTGKTFTMEGTEESRGVNYRTLNELFRIIGERNGLLKYELSVSVLEVYNEHIRDLLASTSQPGQAAKRLEIRQEADGIHHVPGLVEAQVNNMDEVWHVLQTGSNARATGSTNSNEHSSRSHCVHCVTVRGENMMNGECTRSKLWLVDLAGSERLAKTDVQGERLKEAQNINKSLSALGDVISSLATKSPHIPYRNSKLTHLLQDSLGGDSKTLMFVQISPNENDVNETLCSLNFASRVKGVEMGPARKQMDPSELCKYKQMVEKAKQDMKAKDDQIKKMEDTILSMGLKMRARDSTNKSLQERVKELETQLVIERKLSRQHVDSKVAERQAVQQQAVRPPLPVRQFGNQKANESFPLSRDLLNVMQPCSENNRGMKQLQESLIESKTGDLKWNLARAYATPIQKENKVDILEQQPFIKRTGRASICGTAQRIPMVRVPRRTSLIPLPSVRNTGLPLLPITTPQRSRVQLTPLRKIDPIEESTPRSFRGNKNNHRLSIVLRKSIQMKMKLKSPLHHHKEMDKARVSVGGKLRLAQRVLVSDLRGPKFVQQRQQEKVKERGWNRRASMKNLTG